MSAERVVLAVIIGALLAYELATIPQYKGNTISEFVWELPWYVRVILFGISLHLCLKGGILHYITERFAK